MPFYGSGKKSRSYVKKTKSSKPPKQTKINSAKVNSSQVKNIVERTLARKVEVKTLGIVEENKRVIVSITTTNPGRQWVLSQALQCNQGAGQGSRDGNKITLKKFVFRGFIHADPQTTCPSYVRMLIITPLDGSSSLANGADLFNQGNTSYGPNPDFADMFNRINKDKYKLNASKLFKVGPMLYSTNYNNDFKNFRTFSIDCTKYFPKIIKYNDNAATPTNTKHPIVCFISVDFDGAGSSGTADASPGNSPFISWVIDASYTEL